MVLANLGAMQMDVGDYGQAQINNEEALSISRQIGSPMGQSMSLINLALLNHYQGRQEESLKLSQQVLEINKQMNSRRVQGYALIPMGHALHDLGKSEEAQEAYWQSLALWHELDQPNLAVEQQASLARTHMAQGRQADALTQIDKILTHLKQEDPLEGMESPFRVYLTCYQVLQKCEDPRAQDVLETAHTQLHEKASEIVDEPMRHTYLNNVPAHREIVAAFFDNTNR